MKKILIFLKAINEIHIHIKKSTKKSLINELSKKLLRLENYAVKRYCLPYKNEI